MSKFTAEKANAKSKKEACQKRQKREIWVDQRWDGKPGIFSLLRTYKAHTKQGGK